MSDDSVTQVPSVFSSKERAALVARALSDAARRARFSTKSRRGKTGTTYKARRSERLARLLQIVSFVVLFAIPTLVSSVYFGLIASGQYVSEARFTVRGGLPPGLDSAGSLSEGPGAMIIQDTQVIMNYILSRAMVEQLDKSIGLTKMYQSPDIDYFSRLGEHKPIEKIVKYWDKHVDLKVEMPGGIVVMGIRAFRPEDAATIATAALSTSENLVNTLNDQMRSDALDLARRERERAQTRLADARAALEKARNQEGLLSAKDASQGLNDLLTQVRGQLLKSQQTYESMRRFVNTNSPQLRNLQTKIDASKKQVEQLQAQMTSMKQGGGAGEKPLSGSMSSLDYATLNNEIAEKIYAGALIALERATIASETKLMYITTFVNPVAAQEAKYPRRGLDIAITAGAGLALWGVAFGLIALVRKGFV
ncbi:Lipopolysaccharide biosynthesis protein [Beijerinckiaceae bacterium RH AL1]|nr:lipopolysaccharide biosynthesis protein [Beijerinckiaceae bacterium]VVB45911.1 Lipopolysaccharide biosynthesis protein [Beijerinckiaceae bacterium RH CH11]VVB45989.1 Lipopolysaccharide biosynthesis protein [Beijerinckiaceae bacterium RH AL8]VVC55103.1 Lipopolysaccharide biosynthesis protein [Beijerinckiaceae bacterium RH AL1]